LTGLARSPRIAAATAAADTKPPSKPTSSKAAVLGTTGVVLSWGASSDNTGVAGYRVYSDGALLATVSVRDYADGGLAPGSGHTYQVRAVDLAGNESATSAARSVTSKAVSTGSNGTLAGAVYDASGSPLAGAVVTVTVATGAVKTATTSTTGVWKLTGVKPGACSAGVSLSGYRTSSFALTAVKGQTVVTGTNLDAS